MAQFEGTIKEFTKFVGAYARLKVAFISAKYKKQIGKCEECGVSNLLDAAHIKGKGRALIIANILSEFMEDDIIRIDLNEFEERFIDYHLPIESTIRILCRQCHRKYDQEDEEGKINTKDLSVSNENVLIERLIKEQMNKSKAMMILNERRPGSLTNSNTIFSNIITRHNGWWLQPENDKFKSDLHIILNDIKGCNVYIFKLPANTIPDPAKHFKQRNDKYRANCSDIYIPASGTKFAEKNGFDFSIFLVEKVDY